MLNFVELWRSRPFVLSKLRWWVILHHILGWLQTIIQLFVVCLKYEVLLVCWVVIELETCICKIFRKLCLSLWVFEIPDWIFERRKSPVLEPLLCSIDESCRGRNSIEFLKFFDGFHWLLHFFEVLSSDRDVLGWKPSHEPVRHFAISTCLEAVLLLNLFFPDYHSC